METKGRCRTCFAELSKGRCDRCIHRKVVVHRSLAACEAMGPARTMIHEMQQGRRDCIAAAASLMVYQWLEQGIPIPDGVIPVPTSFWQKQKTGLDIPLCLAKEVGNMFSVPVFPLLRRKLDRPHFLQTGEFCSCFQAKKIEGLCDRKVVLIALEGNDSLFRLAGGELQPFFPAYIGALSFAT
jgi:predicted amidophosphoribosyltransferase